MKIVLRAAASYPYFTFARYDGGFAFNAGNREAVGT